MRARDEARMLAPAATGGDSVRFCPDTETLAAFLEGRLEDAERARVADHVSSCDDCYDVVRESVPLLAEPRPSRKHLLRWALPLAAALLVAVGLWRALPSGNSYDRTIEPLVDAVGKERYLEARLVGGFAFGPLRPHFRDASQAQDRGDWGVRSAVLRAEENARRGGSIDDRHVAAVGRLLLGDTEGALDALERLSRDRPSDSTIASDLAAAYLTKGLREDSALFVRRALDLLSTPTVERGARVEERYNKAIALRWLGRRNESRTILEDLVRSHDDVWSKAELSRAPE